MLPLASLGHVGNAADGFDYDDGAKRDPEDSVRTSVTKLHLGTDFEIPVEASNGDLILRPGLSYVMSDRDGGEFGRPERSSAARVDFGVDYRLEGGISFGFRSYYSGLGGSELESFGASLDMRMRF